MDGHYLVFLPPYYQYIRKKSAVSNIEDFAEAGALKDSRSEQLELFTISSLFNQKKRIESGRFC